MKPPEGSGTWIATASSYSNNSAKMPPFSTSWSMTTQAGKAKRPPSSIAHMASAIAAWIGLLSIVFAGLYYWNTFKQNEERDRITAATRVCESYATSPMITGLVTEIRNMRIIRDNSDNPVFDSATNKVMLRGYTFASFPILKDRDQFGHKFKMWFNILDAIATGLKRKVYDEAVIKNCLGGIFQGTSKMIGDPSKYFIGPDDYPRVVEAAKTFE